MHVTVDTHRHGRGDKPLYEVARDQETPLKAGEKFMGRTLEVTKGLNERTHTRHTPGHPEEFSLTPS